MTCMDCEPGSKRPIDPRSGPRSPRCWTHVEAKRKASRKANHDRTVARTYGLEPGEYERLYRFQNGRCAICRRATGKARRLAVDHDHDTGRVRGLCCGPCNKTVLGHSGELITRAAEYLSNPPYERMHDDDQHPDPA